MVRFDNSAQFVYTQTFSPDARVIPIELLAQLDVFAQFLFAAQGFRRTFGQKSRAVSLDLLSRAEQFVLHDGHGPSFDRDPSLTFLHGDQMLLSLRVKFGAQRLQRGAVGRQLNSFGGVGATIAFVFDLKALKLGTLADQAIGFCHECGPPLFHRLELAVQFARRAAIGGIPFLPQRHVMSVLIVEFFACDFGRRTELLVFECQSRLAAFDIRFAFRHASDSFVKLLRLTSKFVGTALQFVLPHNQLTTLGGQSIGPQNGVVW